MQSQQMKSLGYREATIFQLFRTEEGIVSEENGLIGLLNYPTTVQFSGRAIRKMDREYSENGNSSTIAIYANLKSGRKVPLFSIDSNFFGRVQRDRDTAKQSIDYDVALFGYEADEKAFYSRHQEAIKAVCTTVNMLQGSVNYDDMMRMLLPMAERSFTDIGNQEAQFERGDVVTSFGAKYLLGRFFASETHEFSLKFFKSDVFAEKVVLKIDVTDRGEWDLAICQRESSFLEKVEKEIEMPDVPAHFICPITQEIMKDPVVGLDGNSYERRAITEWLAKHTTSPISREPMGNTLIPNRQLKEAIDCFNKGQ